MLRPGAVQPRTAVPGPVRIIGESGNLILDDYPGYTGDLEHRHYDRFRITWRHPVFDMEPNSFIRFQRDDRGEVDGFPVKFCDDVDFRKVRA